MNVTRLAIIKSGALRPAVNTPETPEIYGAKKRYELNLGNLSEPENVKYFKLVVSELAKLVFAKCHSDDASVSFVGIPGIGETMVDMIIPRFFAYPVARIEALPRDNPDTPNTFRFKTGDDSEIVRASKKIFVVNGVSNGLRDLSNVLKMKELEAVDRYAVSIWDRSAKDVNLDPGVAHYALVQEEIPELTGKELILIADRNCSREL